MLIVALVIFLGMTVNAKTGLDRWIYGAVTAAIIWALVYYRQIPALSGWIWN
jgi:hypothetical protein